MLAVVPSLHPSSVGRALLGALDTGLVASGCRMLQVKTVGPSNPHAGYQRTRQFYATVGFWPLEEVDLWGPDNPASSW